MAGMDPYEERLLIVLLGSGVGLLALLSLLFVCCRKYRLDRKRHQRPRPSNGRPMPLQIYQPTGHQPAGGPAAMMMAQPGMLDPSRLQASEVAAGSEEPPEGSVSLGKPGYGYGYGYGYGHASPQYASQTRQPLLTNSDSV